MSYRPRFHVSPPSGRLNDPNGMFLDGTDLHLFYQHDPGFPHAPKRTGWGHVVVDLTQPGRPRHFPDALYPDRPYDLHGCYSGGAVSDGDNIWLFYTGNLKQDGRRIPSQNRVRVDNLGPEGGFYIRDAANPLIPNHAPGYTGHFRDPMLTQDPTGGWRMVLGAQREDETGAVVVYYSADLQNWEFGGELRFSGVAAEYVSGEAAEDVPGGYMWECPNLLRMRDTATGEDLDVLVICPQFPGRDECGYLVGRLRGLEFEVVRGYRPLDFGHAFYAPQLISYGEGQALMVGWMGLPGQDDTPTLSAEGWVHTLTLPRVLELADATLSQAPVWPSVPGEVTFRTAEGQAPVVYGLFAGTGADARECARVEVEGASASVVRFGPGGEQEVRQAPTRPGSARLIADSCAVEVFTGDGAAAFSVPVFAPNGQELYWRKLSE
ncbi:glycoside hydrolase family 32 protein [Corynebacterium lizhenjunii]|uniref:beta-fructofuranosidase n=1 Tax=Corynebacterium lizhenjunii TaxID=2709394 RepID=A0A7T0KFG4_9CORY|nr:glycoside hydrolase family 32 protein [Corynebacterium lizhenjunii]QPK79559.1 glycoside hydrolase family 32 protein [Corynebacterium lizhenjunii]